VWFALLGDEKCVHNCKGEKHESRNPLGGLNYRQEDNNQMDVKVTGRGRVYWTLVDQNRFQVAGWCERDNEFPDFI